MFGIHNWTEVRRNVLFEPTQCWVYAKDVAPYRHCAKSGCPVCQQSGSYPSCEALQDIHANDIDKYKMSTVKELDTTCGGGYECCQQQCDECCDTDSDGRESCHECNCQCVSSVDEIDCDFDCTIQYEAQIYVAFLWNSQNGKPDLSGGMDPLFPTQLKYVTKVYDNWKVAEYGNVFYPMHRNIEGKKIEAFLDTHLPAVPYLRSIQEEPKLDDEQAELQRLAELEILDLAAVSKYRGSQNKTKQGYTCQRWDAQQPHRHLYSMKSHFDYPSSIDDVHHNFCRGWQGFEKTNGNLVGGPYKNSLSPNISYPETIWCFTTDAQKRWDICAPLVDPIDSSSDVDPIGSSSDVVDRTGRAEHDKKLMDAMTFNENPVVMDCSYEPLTRKMGGEHDPRKCVGIEQVLREVGKWCC